MDFKDACVGRGLKRESTLLFFSLQKNKNFAEQRNTYLRKMPEGKIKYGDVVYLSRQGTYRSSK